MSLLALTGEIMDVESTGLGEGRKALFDMRPPPSLPNFPVIESDTYLTFCMLLTSPSVSVQGRMFSGSGNRQNGRMAIAGAGKYWQIGRAPGSPQAADSGECPSRERARAVSSS